jgi:integrase/recombinase XerD
MTNAITTVGTSAMIPAQAETDDRLIDLWLHGRPATTQAAYRREVVRFFAHTGTPLRQTTLGDVQGFVDSLSGLAPATQARSIHAIKSLFAFALRLGYIPFDVAASVRAPKVKNRLAERIMSEADVHRLLALETHPRNRVLLRLLYAAGVRASEACGLTWRDLADREEGGVLTVYGKGQKTRHLRLPQSIWNDLRSLQADAGGDESVFPSRKGGALTAGQIWRLVKAAAKRAGLDPAVSCHWLRHAHASHSLDRGAPLHLVQATLGHANVATTSRYTHARPGQSSALFLAV